MSTNKFRFENGKVFVYDKSAAAYIYCGNLNGRSKKQFIDQYNQANN